MRGFLNSAEVSYADSEGLNVGCDEEITKAAKVLTSPPKLPPECPLTVQQMIGLYRFQDLDTRMDRDEVSWLIID